ncbi:MAG: hypothetical protein Tsb0013_21340 [Phycisphaerales bacterium]
MPDHNVRASQVLGSLWGIVLVALLFYFGTHMSDFAAASVGFMNVEDNLASRYFRGLVMCAVAFPIAIAYWTALFLLAPSKRSGDVQLPVVIIVAAVMLATSLFTLAGTPARSISGVGVGIHVFHILLSTAVVLAAVYVAAPFARTLAGVLARLFAPPELSDHFQALHNDAPGPARNAQDEARG